MTDRAKSATDEWRKAPGKKDTKRWCKGHVGREHVPDVRFGKHWNNDMQCHPDGESDLDFLWGHDKHGWTCYHEVSCSACGKLLEWTPERCPMNVA